MLINQDKKESSTFKENGFRSALSERIFLDRYAKKSLNKDNVLPGAVVIFTKYTDDGFRRREIGVIESIDNERKIARVRYRDNPAHPLEEVMLDHIDVPLELTYDEMCERVAKAVASIELDYGVNENDASQVVDDFNNILKSREFVPGGRILSGAGAPGDLTFFNCYVVPIKNDTRGGILETARQQFEIMSRGGGVGINVSTLRPTYSYVKSVNGRSSGAVSWADLYSIITNKVEQGGSRRGALMIILDVWHPDIERFITAKHAVGFLDFANISVGITDEFMEAVKNDSDWDLVFPDTNYPDYDQKWDGDLQNWKDLGRKVIVHKTIKARELWDKMCSSAWRSAEPGLYFVDRANKESNSWYFNKLRCTNPCVVGSTRVYTDRGLVKIEDIVGEDVELVVDSRFGQEAAGMKAAQVVRSGHKEVRGLYTKEGYFIFATSDHRVMTPIGWRELGSLNKNDKIHILNRPGLFGNEGDPGLGSVLGWFIGDGHFNGENDAVLSFYGPKRQLVSYFYDKVQEIVKGTSLNNREYTTNPCRIEERDKETISSVRLARILKNYGLLPGKNEDGLSKKTDGVPEIIFKGSREVQKAFLSALFSADGSFQGTKEKGHSVRLSSSSAALLVQVQQVLLNFGIFSKIHKERRPEGWRKLPDGKGGTCEYLCRADHELIISKQNMKIFAEEIGFLIDDKQEPLEAHLYSMKRGPYQEHFIATVDSIINLGSMDVFDATEPVTNSFVGNGIVLHNCGEQSLPPFGVCNLGAVNLGQFVKNKEFWGSANDVIGESGYTRKEFEEFIDERLDSERLIEVTKKATQFLDNVIDLTPYFIPENEHQQMSERRVGLGIMGLAEMLIRMGVRYGSKLSKDITEVVFHTMRGSSYEESVELSKTKGPFPEFDASKFLQSGFSKRLPNYLRDKIKDHGIRNVTLLTVAPTGSTGSMTATSTGIEPYFMFEFDQKGRLGTHRVNEPIVNEYYDYVGQMIDLPGYFVESEDLSTQDHVEIMAIAQKYVDSNISKTCNLPTDASVEDVANLYMSLYDLGCKGGTVYRDKSREEQCLIKVEEDEDDSKDRSVATTTVGPRVKPLFGRPRFGLTHYADTHLGRVHVTLNLDNNNFDLFDVFITLSKSGSDIDADTDAIGRLISLILRLNSSIPTRERLELVIDQLSGIAANQSFGFGKNRVRSVPDGIAKCLGDMLDKISVMENFLSFINDSKSVDKLPGDSESNVNNGTVNKDNNSSNGDGNGQNTDRLSKFIQMCPTCGCASAVRSDGCFKCLGCGYSAC